MLTPSGPMQAPISTRRAPPPKSPASGSHVFKHTNLLRTFSDLIHFGFHEQSIDYSTKEALSAFDFNSSAPYRLQTKLCSQQASSPLDRQIYPWEAIPSSPHLLLGGSPLLHPFKGHSSDHRVCNSRFYQRRNSIFFMEKNHFSFCFFQFNVDANNSHYRLPILVNYKNDSFFLFF